ISQVNAAARRFYPKYLPGVHAAVVGSARFTYVSRFGGQLFLSLLLRLPGSCSATPEWGITPRGDGNHLGFFLATFDVAINVVRVSPLLLKGACSLPEPALVGAALAVARDRKSTRLNSSHVSISYAVFCLKKKKKKTKLTSR